MPAEHAFKHEAEAPEAERVEDIFGSQSFADGGMPGPARPSTRGVKLNAASCPASVSRLRRLEAGELCATVGIFVRLNPSAV